LQDTSTNGGERLQVTVGGDEGSPRLDRVLAARCETLSRSRLKALILAGSVAVKGAVVRDPAYHVASGDSITINVPEAAPAEPEPEDIPLDIVYEDDDIIVIDKPKGLVVHPAAGHATGTLVNALIAHCGDSLSGIGGVKRPGIVHRLDKDTTGRMVVAKTDKAHHALSKQFAEKTHGPLERGYLALVWGVPNRPKGTIDAPLDRHPHAREKQAVRASGRSAITHWQVLERFAGPDGKPVASLLACTLETGRTHQIRVHLAHIGHPLLGDATYGTGFKTKISRLGPKAAAALETLGRQALHAYLLVIEHPETGDVLEFQSELPGDLRCLRDALHMESREAGPSSRK
jgi:23S rRNA pseudouridine1911/1915/1917 synthase